MWQWFLSLFKKQEPIKEVVQPVNEVITPPQYPIPVNWTQRATEIVMDFEGNEPWANITGNFDGMGLTCGALGWTFGYGDQQRLVKLFVSVYGKSKLLTYMPKFGEEYLQYVNLSNQEGVSKISAWSFKEKVLAPYLPELTKLWQSPEMISIQKEEIEKTIYKKLKKKLIRK